MRPGDNNNTMICHNTLDIRPTELILLVIIILQYKAPDDFVSGRDTGDTILFFKKKLLKKRFTV